MVPMRSSLIGLTSLSDNIPDNAVLKLDVVNGRRFCLTCNYPQFLTSCAPSIRSLSRYIKSRSELRKLLRRRFSTEEKHRIVRKFLHLSIPLARFARERDLHYNQLSRWRKDYLAGKFGPVSTLRLPDLQWIPVTVEKPAPPIPSAGPVAVKENDSQPGQHGEEGFDLKRLNIRLPKGTISFKGPCSGALLRTIIEALQ